MKDYDIIIIGAGPAGSCAAAKMLQNNFSVLIIEKMDFPRFVIGESLLPQCMDYLKELDLLELIEAEGFQLKTGAKFFNENKVCEFKFAEKFTEGFDYTYQVKRSKFDHILIKEIQRRGAEVKFKSTVTKFTNSEKKREVTYKVDNGQEFVVNAKFVIDASGYGRVLPRLLDLTMPADLKPKGALFCHLSDKNKPKGAADNIYIHAVNDEQAWIWSIPFSDHTASFGLVGDVDFIKQYSEKDNSAFYKLINSLPVIKERFGGAEVIIPPRSIMNYSSSVKSMFGDGFVLCGNSTEFLDPIFSSGVTLAIASGYKAAALAIKELNLEKVDWQKEYVDELKYGIDVFRSYVNSWYNGDLQKIIFNPTINKQFKRQICSVLAGYVWDTDNQFVKKHNTILSTLAKVLKFQKG